jgi:hypothetical protein
MTSSEAAYSEQPVEERRRLRWEVAEKRSRRQEPNSEISAFCAGWRGLVAQAREAAGSLAGLLPAHEVDDLRAHLSEMAVGPGAGAAARGRCHVAGAG